MEHIYKRGDTMKKVFGLLLCFLLVISLACCSGSGTDPEGADDQNPGASSEQAEDTSGSEKEAASGEDASSGVDIDLTTLSSTMVYAQVYDMVSNPDNFIGKTVRASGPFAVYTDDASGKNYFACIIKDATACCAQGMEFELEGKHDYPADYPELNTDITVEGTFDKYEEAGQTYCTLRKARIIES